MISIRKMISKHSVVWLSVTVFLIALIIVVSVVATTVIPGLMDTMFGGERFEKVGGTGDNSYFTTDEGITDKASALAASNALNEDICEEGFILLKNNDRALPLTGSEKISVFGKNSVNLAYGSSGSVGGDTDKAMTLFESLTAVGFAYNETLKGFYEDDSRSGSPRPDAPAMSDNALPDGFATGETDPDTYPDDVLGSIDEFSDVALVVISRTSGENSDLPTTMKNTTGAMSENDHYLELDENEQNMLKLACETCEKVVLLVNSGTPIELGFLDAVADGDDTDIGYDFSSGVDAAFQIGLPGESGIAALGKLLKGEINPSGRTVDTYARDFMKIPAVENFSLKGISSLDSYTVGGAARDQWFIDYEESIYIGYRYFETRGEGNDEWYNANVVYPFGYGLSYTTFSQEIVEDKTNIEPSSSWDEDTRDLTVTVRVTNTGSRAGKEVVQIYAEPPYENGGVEKSARVLIGYAKTDMLYPASEAGEGKPNSQEVTVTFDPYDFASYDYSGANDNDSSAYELDAGSYTFVVGRNAHEAFDSVSTTLTDDVIFETDPDTGYTVENRFDNADDELGSVLSRDDWDSTYPAMRTADEKAVDSAFISDLENNYDSGNPLTAESDAVKDAAANRAPATVKSNEGMQLYELRGLAADNGLWDELLKRITASSLWDMLSECAFKTPSISYIGKPETLESDGPAGWTKFMGDSSQVYDTCFFACEPVLAATWNVELAEAMGNAIGNEGIIGREETSTAAQMCYSGWYAPGVNLHRTPFGGRNPEYYSEDPVLSGKLAAAVVRGAAKKGVYCYVKHFAANEQETHRGGVCTWLTEQSLRELYLKPFEYAVKEGGSTAIMSSFNRIGTKWTGGDYRLMTEVLRNEWGFDGVAICDFASGQGHMSMEQMVYAGGDTWLDTIKPSDWFDKNDSLDVYVMQEAAKHVLYAVVNSNAMNGMGEGVIYETHLAYWRIMLIVIDIVVPVGLAVWGFFAIRSAIKKNSVTDGQAPQAADESKTDK